MLDEALTRRTLDLLGSSRNDAYEAALAALREDTRDWWADMLARESDELDEDEEPATAEPLPPPPASSPPKAQRSGIHGPTRPEAADHAVGDSRVVMKTIAKIGVLR